MGETTNEIKTAANAGEKGETAGEIRSGIEQTRSNLSATIDALQDKLVPTRIAEQVKAQVSEKATEAFDNVKSVAKKATKEKAGKVMAKVSETVTEFGERAGTAVSGGSSTTLRFILDNPLPCAALGLGLGILSIKWRRKTYTPPIDNPLEPSSHSSAEPLTASSIAASAKQMADKTATAVSSAGKSVKGAAASTADATRRQLHDVSDRAKQTAQSASERTKQTAQSASERIKAAWQENPLTLGVAAVATGALLGLALPTTRLEGDYMGKARDRVVDGAKSLAQDIKGKVQHVTEEAGATAKNVAEQEGLMIT